MKSMTGFGRAESTDQGLRCAVELSSVNRKQSDIDIRLPREWAELDAELRKLVAGAKQTHQRYWSVVSLSGTCELMMKMAN